MGRKKKFIDKKKSATFHLLARDTSTISAAADGGAALADRVFVRVDDNSYSVPGFADEDREGDDDAVDEPDSIFGDAPGDTDDDEGSCPPPWIGGGGGGGGGPSRDRAGGALPDHVRRQILELGLPDDGYNYLLHLREIKNTGGGSAYYHNSKARLDRVPLDVKAYDASRVRIDSEAGEDTSVDPIYSVALKTKGVKVQKVVDPDVERMLDDSDLSRFGSDVEDLEEDFVVMANQPEGKEEMEEEQVEEDVEEVQVFNGEDMVDATGESGVERDSYLRQEENGSIWEDGDGELGGNEKPRVRRLLDEQFDLLTLREYEDDSDSDDAGYIDTEGEPLAAKLKDALKEYAMDDLEKEDKYRVPGDFGHGHEGTSTSKQLDISADVIRKCAEYAEMYCDDSQDDEEVVVVGESSDESEVWDCETIISTYSNLDNHPGKIQAPENPKRRILKNLSGDTIITKNVIALRGKEKLPVEFLPNNKSVEKVKMKASSGVDKLKRKPHGDESKEEKKERKAAVKEERREARRAKKDLKGLYRCEAQRAQKVAAVAGPSSVHLM